MIGVSEHRSRPVGHAVALQVLKAGVEHRFEMPEVRRVDGDLGGENDLLLVSPRPARCRPVGAASPRAHHTRAGIGQVDLPVR